MAGSIKGLFKRKIRNFGRPDKFLKEEAKQWEKRAKRFDMTPEMPADTTKVVPMPDEEEIRRNKRRGISARGGGRASTIFTQGDRLGP